MDEYAKELCLKNNKYISLIPFKKKLFILKCCRGLDPTHVICEKAGYTLDITRGITIDTNI